MRVIFPTGDVSSKVRLLGQDSDTLFGLKNQWISRVVSQHHFRTLDRRTIDYSCKRYKMASLQTIVFNAIVPCDYFYTHPEHTPSIEFFLVIMLSCFYAFPAFPLL